MIDQDIEPMEEDEEEEIILSELSDEDLVLQMHDDLYDGLKEEIVEGTDILLERGWSPDQVLEKALVDGMTIVGIDFRDGILFVPEVLLAANAMKGGMAILRPLLAETGAKPVGKMVIGTVKGDIEFAFVDVIVTVNAENGTVEELRNVLTDLSASEAWQTAFAGTETYVLNNDNATSLVNKVEAAIVLNSN